MKKGNTCCVHLPSLFLLVIAMINAGNCWSQRKDIFSFESAAEKIYLQLDNRVYTNNSTIWFKAIVTDAVDHIPSRLSGVLYVELADPTERIIERKLIKIDNGTGNGFFELSADYTEGVYQVRAYTEWNKNFGPGFFFKEYIEIFATGSDRKPNPIPDVTIVNGQNNEQFINALFNPLAIDSAHTKDLTLLLSFEHKKDTITIRKNDKGNYLLHYRVPVNEQLVTLKMLTGNQRTYARTILLGNSFLDLQFFPESGELVQGLPAALGIKALDSIGKGKTLSGEILNRQDEVIAFFSTNQLGMGRVTLPSPNAGDQYIARVALTGEAGTVYKTFPIPPAAPKGYVLNVSKSEDRFRIKAFTNYNADSLSVRAACRGMVYFDIKGRVKNGVLEFTLPVAELPEGVIAFTIMRDSLEPVAERLFFNSRPAERLQLLLSSDKQVYQQRDMSQLTVDIKDSEGKPIGANISLMVINREQLGLIQDARQNIISYMLLSSDLKGSIERPAFYFEEGKDRSADLDALMLTQGWRKYNYTRTSGDITYQAEPFLMISGNVKGGLFGKKQKKGTSLTMMTFGKPPSVATEIADSLGRFSFAMDDNFQQTVNVLIQTNNKSGEKKDYTITLDKKAAPPVQFDQVRTVEKPDSIVRAYVKKNIERKKTEDAYIAATEGITLGEVIVKGTIMTPERKKVTDRFGKPSTIIEGDDIRAKEEKWSYGLYSVLLFRFPDKISIVRASDGTLYARHFNREPTLVVIDGIPVMEYDYPLIPSIPPSEVKSFEIIEYAHGFSSLYCEVFPPGCSNPPAWGNVIAIYTYGKSGIFGARRAPGLTKTAVTVFSTPREFYAPKYEQLKTDDWKKQDLRTLIHWAPTVRTDSMGKAVVSFYNADITGKMMVIAEAISPVGEIGYQQLFYDVRKKEE